MDPADAPLISIPEAPAPKGAQAAWLQGAGDVRLRTAWFPLPGTARGAAFLSPGRTEPIEKYFETIQDLHRRGFEVLAHDWRGQGLSQRLLPDPLKGHADGLEPFLSDVHAVLERNRSRLTGPVVAVAHSMGAALMLLALARGEGPFAGAILSAPMLAVSTEPAPRAAARIIASSMKMSGLGDAYAIKGADPLKEAFDGNHLTHDPARYARYKAQLRACPELRLGGVTWGWLDFALRLETALAQQGLLEAIETPVRIVAAGEDALVLNAPMRQTAWRLAEGSYAEVPGARHEILMETDERRDQFWLQFDALTGEIMPPPA